MLRETTSRGRILYKYGRQVPDLKKLKEHREARSGDFARSSRNTPKCVLLLKRCEFLSKSANLPKQTSHAKFKKHAKPRACCAHSNHHYHQKNKCSEAAEHVLCRPMTPSSGQTLFEVRRLKRGFAKKILRIKPEEGADKQSMLNYLAEPLRTVSHLHFRNPHVYTVRRMNRTLRQRSACNCAAVCDWDPQTGEAEVLCVCAGAPFQYTAEYAGECTDTACFYMRDDLCVPGSQRARGARAGVGKLAKAGAPARERTPSLPRAAP